MLTRTIYHYALLPVMALSILLASAPVFAGQTANPNLFSRAKMEEVDLKGLQVWLGLPVQVTAQIGWHMSWPEFKDVWSFVHLTPFIAKFPQGELIATYTLDPDTASNPVSASGFQISKDGGEHWGRRYSLLMQHIPMIFVPKANNSLMAIPSEMFEQTPGDEHNLRGPYYLFEQGGARLTVVPDGVRVVDWPWPIAVDTGPQPRDNWHAEVILTSNALEVGGKLLATGYYYPGIGDKFISSGSAVILASEDGGYTWRYFSTVAGPDLSLTGQSGYEGPNEMTMTQLADGDLMAVFRVGGNRKWNVHRAYSHDGGRTWTKPNALPAWSVEPQVMRTVNGTIALATGRPGIGLWLSTDPRGTTWQNIDIVAYHNRRVQDPNERFSSFGVKPGVAHSEDTAWKTSSYTGLVEVAPNRLLLVYD